ncbi:hypothetical protein VZT92_008340 [Zoarces viviparus]|uniref:Uncharacterized protein n=1 Tax=Zoarces viviparus TaxID=48416 RepID=A0AAW1FFG3_ZOAVI
MALVEQRKSPSSPFPQTTIDTDGESDQLVQASRKISSRQLVLQAVRETVVEGIEERGGVPVALGCYGAELNGVGSYGSPSLLQVKQTSSDLSSRRGMVEDFLQFLRKQLD